MDFSEPGHEPPSDLDWSPARSGGAAFRTHQLVHITRPEGAPPRIELHPSTAARTLVGVFALATVIAAGVLIWAIVTVAPPLIAVTAALGLTFAVLVVLLHRQLDNARVFDAEPGRYWSTRAGDQAIEFTEIRGVQVLTERVIASETDHDAHELNLVLADGRRVNVVDHADHATILANAREIAALVGVPVWRRSLDVVSRAP